ncbi:MAG: hypothetical protein FWE05_05160 [Defluviitaleaceae bacterium]|nr:hypothetical protein [Defluviitaleaceae bacterium]
MNKIFTRTIAFVVAMVMAVASFAIAPMHVHAETGQNAPLAYGTWYEAAWATWTGSANDAFRVYVENTGGNAIDWRTGNAINDNTWLRNWTLVNDQDNAPLVRLIDTNTWRVDIPGLPMGTYAIRVTDTDGDVLFEVGNLQTQSFPRYGAAFTSPEDLLRSYDYWAHNHPEMLVHGTMGGYLPDGRVNPSAIIMYVSHGNWDDLTTENLVLDSEFRNGNPLIIRFLGTVGSFENISFIDEEAIVEMPPGVREQATGGDNSRMLVVEEFSHDITFEGIGPDAVIYGWGIRTIRSSNLVFRNLTVDQYQAFGIRIGGQGNNNVNGPTVSHAWVHHNFLRAGQNLFLHADDETDRSMARGVVDVEPNVTGYTVAYNHFFEVDKTNLIVGGVQNHPLENNVHRHYGTFHHNWYQGVRERNPRVRNHNIHVFNNLYQDIEGHQFHYRLMDRHTGYAIAAGHNATIWAEGNIFENVNFPFVRSRHGHARGYAPHQGHNHLFGDAAGFMVTGDNISLETGDSIGTMPVPSLTEISEGRNFVQGIVTQADLDALLADINALQPNVLDTTTQTMFNPAYDLGITIDLDATLVEAPYGDELYGANAGFPSPNAAWGPTNENVGFDGEFRPSAGLGNGVWGTSTPAQANDLRSYIIANAGTMPPPVPTNAPAMPIGVEVSLNRFEYFMHRQHSPMPSLRHITYANTFTINWSDISDISTEAYEVALFENGEYVRTLGIVLADARPNIFITQDITDLGNLVYAYDGEQFDRALVHIGAEGRSVLFPRAGAYGYTTETVPAYTDLARTSAWVVGELGETYYFGVRAINSAGTSNWAIASETVPSRLQGIESISQVNTIGSVAEYAQEVVRFEVRTLNIFDGEYEISLSVPRSLARDTMPWPTPDNMTRAIRLNGVDGDSIPFGAGTRNNNGNFDNWGAESPTTGNGGTGTITIANGVGTIEIIVDNNTTPIFVDASPNENHEAAYRRIHVLDGIYDLVLTIMVDGNEVAIPFGLFINR